MKIRNPRGLAYGAAGAVAAIAVCGGAMVLAPAPPSTSVPGGVRVPVLAAARGGQPSQQRGNQQDGQQQGQQGQQDGQQQGNQDNQQQGNQDNQQGFQQGFLTAPLTASPDCTLQVPANPLTANGLATPYVLQSAGKPCLETDPNQAAFVQAVILDPATGNLSVYNPVVSDANTAAVPPPVPVLPPGAVVTVWTGFNGNVLKLTGPGAGGFVNFAQQGYDNSLQFFGALRFAEFRGKVTVPALGTANDGMACPSTRDFSVVDQDQSDNVVVAYPQFDTPGVTIVNGSDDASLNGRIDPALGCITPASGGGLWKVPLISSLTANVMSTAGPLEEEQARAGQQAPVALVPGLDPFVTSNGKPNLFLQDLYRLQVDQSLTFNSQDTKAYCLNLLNTGEPRLKLDATTEALSKPPAFGALGTNLALHLAARFAATWVNLTCPALTGQPSPITVTIDPNTMLATAAVYK